MIRKVVFSGWLILAAFSVVFTGCIQDKCVTTNCKNEGVCVDGTCSCTFGYEGDYCEKQWNDKFIADWQVKETGKAGVVLRQYSLTAGGSMPVDSFYMIGLNEVDDSVFAYLKAYKSFSLVPRMLVGGDSIISGEGVLGDNGVVTGVYSLWKDSVQQNITFILTR